MARAFVGGAPGSPATACTQGRDLTTPSSTQKPSCSRTCGRRMMAVVTGGQCTMLRVTSVCDFTSCRPGVVVVVTGLT